MQTVRQTEFWLMLNRLSLGGITPQWRLLTANWSYHKNDKYIADTALHGIS